MTRPARHPESAHRLAGRFYTLRGLTCAVALACTATALPARAQTTLYWGDLHLHSNFSLDAYGVGNTYVTPDLAYRFARGIPIYHKTLDTKVQIDRPLDFLAVTDHASNLGIDVQVTSGNALLQQTPRGRELIASVTKDTPWGGLLGVRRAAGEQGNEIMQQVTTLDLRQSAWQQEIEAADKNNIPGTFTTFIAWEWTAMIDGKNLHRNVISNAGPEQASRFYPYSAG